jgi:hypothetical protein
VGETLARMHKLDAAGEPSPTWPLQTRYRALIWNADRVAQTLLLLASHGEDRPVALQLPPDWSMAECAGMLAAVAVGHAMLRYVYPAAVGMVVELPLGVRPEDARGALAPLRAATAVSGKASPVVVPLSELALVAAAVLE